MFSSSKHLTSGNHFNINDNNNGADDVPNARRMQRRAKSLPVAVSFVPSKRSLRGLSPEDLINIIADSKQMPPQKEVWLTHEMLDEILAELPEQHVFYLLGLENLPRIVSPIGSIAPNAFCSAWLITADQHRTRIGEKVCWPAKFGSQDPVWKSAREFVAPHGTKTILHFEVWHGELMLAETDLVLGLLPVGTFVSIPLFLTDAASARCKSLKPPILTFCLTPPLETEKKVFFVRHGESTWNKAQAEMDVFEMITQVDHPLNETGVHQARRLCDAIVQASRNDSDVQDFLAAEAVVSSPLTRAVQTALIATKPVLDRVGSLVLLSNAREKRNFGGMDSAAREIGLRVRDRAIQELLRHGMSRSDLEQTQVDTADVQHRWWSHIKESKKEIEVRIAEFMNQIRWLPATRVIVVGHSHFFRELFRNFLHPEFVANHPKFAHELTTSVIENCGVLAVDVDFFHTHMFMDVRLMFNSHMARTKEPFSLKNLLSQSQLNLMSVQSESASSSEQGRFAKRSRIRTTTSPDA